MFNRLLHIALLLALEATASAQNPYLPGKLQGGSGVPGTNSRSPLNSLERAANNLPGVTILTDTFGNQRLALFVHIEDTCIHYTPAATGNTQNLSAFVEKCSTDSVWYIDWEGKAIFLGAGGGATCDQDWLQISDNSCPDAITDSIYHYKYAAIGARLVWPSAELLVNDSTASAVQIISGSRDALLGFYDNQNGYWSTIDQSGVSTLWYINPTGEWRVISAGGGTPQSPGAPFVNQFAIDPNDTPLPIIQAYLYPNTRNDTNTVRNFLYTDPVGKFRSQPIDSLVQIVVDSIGGDTTLQRNWYTHNGVTTDLGRVAFIKRSAWWRGLDSIGFIRFTMRPDNFNGPQFTIWQDSLDIDADTIAWRSTYHPELQFHNLEAQATYFHADSLKVVGIGQFPNFPSLSPTDYPKGFYYNPFGGFSGGVGAINSDGVGRTLSRLDLQPSEGKIWAVAPGYSASISKVSGLSTISEIENGVFLNGATQSGGTIRIFQDINADLYYSFFEYLDTNKAIINYLGYSSLNTDIYHGRRAWGIRTDSIGIIPFDWVQSYLPNDTLENAISFYNRAYYWKNEHPIGAAGDTLFHFWAATGPGGEAGKDPGFMTLDQICDHCSAGAVNIYNSNGTTTDNTRIADITETITFRSDDVEADGLFPFRFELDGDAPNEPEMSVWKFPSDSLTLAQSDQEIFFRSTNKFLLWSDDALVGLGDSVQLGHLPTVGSGDIVALAGNDGSPGNVRTLKSLEGTFDADVLSWSAGSAGDRWDAVPANRSAIVVTAGTGTTTPGISVENILIDGAGGGTVSLNYTPSMPGGTYTTVRYVYNEGGAAGVTVNTDQSWQFRDASGDLGTSFTLAAGDNAKLVWIYNATASAARFFVVLF